MLLLRCNGDADGKKDDDAEVTAAVKGSHNTADCDDDGWPAWIGAFAQTLLPQRRRPFTGSSHARERVQPSVELIQCRSHRVSLAKWYGPWRSMLLSSVQTRSKPPTGQSIACNGRTLRSCCSACAPA